MAIATDNAFVRRHDHLARLGRRLSIVARLTVVALVLIPFVRWWLPNGALLMPAILLQNGDAAHLLFEQRLAGTLVDAAITGMGIAVLFALARLGDHFAARRALSVSAANLQLVLGRRLLWLAGAQFAYTPAVALAVTLFNPPGHRILAVAVTGGEITLLVAALVVFLFGRITEEAARLAEENAQII